MKPGIARDAMKEHRRQFELMHCGGIAGFIIEGITAAGAGLGFAIGGAFKAALIGGVAGFVIGLCVAVWTYRHIRPRRH